MKNQRTSPSLHIEDPLIKINLKNSKSSKTKRKAKLPVGNNRNFFHKRAPRATENQSFSPSLDAEHPLDRIPVAIHFQQHPRGNTGVSPLLQSVVVVISLGVG